jgi:hypothetical protein
MKGDYAWQLWLWRETRVFGGRLDFRTGHYDYPYDSYCPKNHIKYEGRSQRPYVPFWYPSFHASTFPLSHSLSPPKDKDKALDSFNQHSINNQHERLMPNQSASTAEQCWDLHLPPLALALATAR